MVGEMVERELLNNGYLDVTGKSQKEIRIRLAMWAWLYSKYSHTQVNDATYDAWSYAVNLDEATDRPDLDKWFKANFIPDTGQWVHNHPELGRIQEMCENFISKSKR